MTTCIACGSTRVEPFLDLHETTLANKFLAPDEMGAPEPRHPLIVGFCHDCSHVQLTHLVPPPEMFEDYLYVSSMSATLTRHLHGLAALVVERFKLGADDLFIDVGCNDGTLLSEAKRRGVRILGIDPAKYNVNGGSIAIGHPFGMTGARCAGHILQEGRRRKAKWGVVTMCIGGGQGGAGLFEIYS